MKNKRRYLAFSLVALFTMAMVGCISISRKQPVVESTTTTIIPKSGSTPTSTTIKRTTNN